MRKFLPIILVMALLGLAVRLITLSPVSRRTSDEPRLYVHFIEVGSGECTLIRTPDNRTVLVDAGSAGSSRHLIRYLARHGVKRIDLMIAAHSDDRHIGGLPDVLDRFGVSRIVDAMPDTGGAIREQVISRIRDRRIDYRTTAEFRHPNVSNCVDIEVVWPLDRAAVGSKEPIVIRVGYKDVGFLLSGSISARSEGYMLSEYHDLRSTVLKVSNHGDSDTTSNELLQIVKPEYAVIFTDRASESAQPDKETIERLSATGAKILRTDADGDIVVSTDGSRVWTECGR